MVDYSNKVVLAPMVRVGTLPMRLLALEYGADLVWTEETIDKKIIGSERKLNTVTGVTEYVKNGRVVFATHPDERGKVIFQIGTADPDLALKAALTVKEDVAGIDVNCGCPKKFSIQGGMGAALLSNQPVLKKILENLVANCGLPVTCKVRILETPEKTRELVKMIEGTGVKAISVHCRTKDMRSSEKAQWDALKDIVETIKTIPVVANGDVFEFEDIQRLKDHTNVSSVMVARGAQWNPSVFRKEGKIDFEDIAKEYLKKCVRVSNVQQNTKYCLLTMNKDPLHTKSEFYTKMMQTKSMLDFCKLFGIEEFYHAEIAAQEERRKAIKTEAKADELPLKRKLEDREISTDAHKVKVARTEDNVVEQLTTKTAVET
ncbi:tRNA-dihydrouridine synthase 2 [Umbelopsis nana]